LLPFISFGFLTLPSWRFTLSQAKYHFSDIKKVTLPARKPNF